VSDDELCQWLTSDDNALENSISLEGRAFFLLLLLDNAVEMTPLPKEDAASILLFKQDAMRLLAGEAVPVKNFESRIIDNKSEGFLTSSDAQPRLKYFWVFVFNVCGWFGVTAAKLQHEYSYLMDCEGPDSINRLFFKWEERKVAFVPTAYAVKALRFVMKKFPATGEDKLNLDYEHERALFLAEA